MLGPSASERHVVQALIHNHVQTIVSRTAQLVQQMFGAKWMVGCQARGLLLGRSDTWLERDLCGL